MLPLYIVFAPSLSLYIWQSFRKGLRQAVQCSDNIAGVWIIAAEVCSTQGCIAASIANSLAFLPAMLAVDPLQTVPVDRLLYETHGDLPDLVTLPQVEPLARTLLLFAQLLAVVAAERKSVFANITAPTDSTEKLELLRSAINNRLQGLTNVSCCTSVPLTDPTRQSATGIDARPSKWVVLLRSAVLILKLATLTFNVKADLLGHADPKMPVSVHALWHSISALASYILTSFTDALEASTCTSPSVSISSGQEEQMLCSALCEHLVAMLQQGVKQPQIKAQRLASLQLLSVILNTMDADLSRHEIKRLGTGSAVSIHDSNCSHILFHSVALALLL